MRTLLHMLLVAALACGLSACGNKGKLKSPTQIQFEAAKKARKEAREKQKQEQQEGAPADTATPQDPPAAESE